MACEMLMEKNHMILLLRFYPLFLVVFCSFLGFYTSCLFEIFHSCLGSDLHVVGGLMNEMNSLNRWKNSSFPTNENQSRHLRFLSIIDVLMLRILCCVNYFEILLLWDKHRNILFLNKL